MNIKEKCIILNYNTIIQFNFKLTNKITGTLLIVKTIHHLHLNI